MVNYVCPRCKYSTVQKTNILAHLSRVRVCKVASDLGGVDVSLEKYQDAIIGEYFDKIYGLEQENLKLRKDLQDASERIEELEKLALVPAQGGAQGGAHTTQNIKIQNMVNIHFHLNSYTDPEIPENAEKLFSDALKKYAKSVPDLVEKLHFNESLPQNMSIKFSNLRSKTTRVYDGKKWRTVDSVQLLKDLVDMHEARLEEFAEGSEARMRYIEQYREIRERVGEAKFLEETMEDIKRVLYDNHKLVKMTPG